jgi:competence protein ComEC
MYFRDQIQATGYVYKAIPLLIGKDESENIILSLRNRLRLKIQNALGEQSALGIILALAIGERSGISAQQWKIFRMSGIGHLMAISGLHVGLASLFGCLIIRLLWRVGLLSGGRIPRPHLVSAGGLLFGLVYAALAGFPLPAVRALTMLSTYTVIGVLANRMYRPEVFLGLAMLTVGILNPIDVSSAGFWLSFVAVWVIFRAQKAYRKNYSTDSDRPFGNGSARYVVRDYVFTLCVIQLALFVGLLPVQALYFGNLSLVSPFINLFYVPVFGLLVVPMILSGCFGLLFIDESIGGGLLSASGWLITWLLEPLSLLNRFSFSTLDLSVNNRLLLVVGVLVVTIFYVRKLRIFLIGTMSVILLAGSTLTSDLKNHEVRMRVFDIGQGLAILIQTRDHAMLFDAGPSFGQFSTGERVLLPALKRYGVTRLDRVIVSHVAADHAGGLDAILLNMVVDDVLSGEPERLEGSRGCHSGETWFWNEVEFRILWPVGDARLTSNNRSCVVQVITGGGRILLTGDIEVKAEQALVRDYGTELESSVLVVPHHGSNTSSTLSFLSTVRAKIAVVSAGSHNRYGHPSPEVVDRYKRLGIRLLNTAQHGEIIIKSGNRKDTVRTWARYHRRFWHS